MSKLSIKSTLACTFLALTATSMHGQVTLNIDAASRGPRIGNLHYGIFYEEINNAGDGGLYAELIRNRSFEDGNLEYWSALNGSALERTIGDLLNDAQSTALNLTIKNANGGIANTGYWGINCVAGDTYTLSFWLKSAAGYKGKATASLVGTNGSVGATGSVDIDANSTWKQYTLTFTATTDIPDSRFNLVFNNTGTVQLDVVSLFPPTYKDRPNGCRRDLAAMLEAMKPAFVRFPGGCYIEGSGTEIDNRRFEWKKTIGPIEERPGHYNYNWGYPSTDGLGFHEFLQLTEDLGAEPLFVANIGLGHGYAIDYTSIDDYIQEALDAIEYCNGDVNTTWGAKRAANGHPEPFNLQLLEIGNENYNYDDITSDHYAERYKAFYDAIKARYPDITLIGNVEAWGTDDPSWRNSYPCEIIDEHYYRTPEWFVNQYNKYDTYDRSKPKVYVGEYAVTDGYGTNGHLKAALGEAVYMLGIERNSDHVIMNSYAPIFMNEERNGGWMPDMIRFTHSQSYGTPSYWVQQLMPNNVGKQNVLWTEDGNLLNSGNKIALSSWSTKVKYDNVVVTDVQGKVIFSDDFSSATTTDWTAPNSNWQRTGGALVQNSSTEQGLFYAGTVNLPSAYTLELDATKVSGAEGFLIGFNYENNRNYSWWNIGGWNNGQHGLQVSVDGVKTDINLKSGSVNTGQTYHLKLIVDGAHIQCYIDDKLIHNVVLPSQRKVYVSSTIDDDTNTMFLKIVNTSATAHTVNINMANASIDDATVTLLTSASNTDENSRTNPTKVIPTEGTAPTITNGNGTYSAPAYSLSILRLKLSNVNYDPAGDGDPTPDQMATITSELYPITCKLSSLHANTTLPVNTASGATIEWSLKEPSDRVLVTPSRFSTTLELTKVNTTGSKQHVATLIASVTLADGTKTDVEIQVQQAPADGMYGYLYTFMNPASEITNYALGTKESLAKSFTVLLDGAEIFDTAAMAPIEKGTRDAYLGRGQRDDEYFITVTDMSNIRSGSWTNHGIALLRSTDLIHWESASFDFHKGKSIFSDPEATVTDGYKTDAEYAKINQVWAPQFMWLPDANNGQGAYMVYYSILSTNSGDNHARIFYSLADRDFKTLTQPRVFYDPGYAVIDTDILLNEYDGLYHMMIKKEGSETGIFEYTSPTLFDATWTEVMHMNAENGAAVEGPTQIRRIDEDIYNLSYMRYDSEYRYKVVDLDHMGLNYSSSSPLAGDGNFQHGSIITVTQQEYEMLDVWSKVVIALNKCERTKDSEQTDMLDDAINMAHNTLDNNHTVAALGEALPPVLDALNKAYSDYMSSVSSEYRDITDQLVNPDFNGNSGTGWSGTTFTATNSGVAEHYDRNYDTYQILRDMPAGTYRLEVQGFYRYGMPDVAQPAHNNGTEELLAEYYMNDVAGQFMSLYAETMSSYPDNVWTANSAFNTLMKYHNNPLTYTLTTTGDLRIGIRKSKSRSGDWNCFDNFKLYYKAADAGVDNVTVDNADNDIVNVYSVTGALIRANVKRANATNGLSTGMYIVGNEKVTVK